MEAVTQKGSGRGAPVAIARKEPKNFRRGQGRRGAHRRGGDPTGGPLERYQKKTPIQAGNPGSSGD